MTDLITMLKGENNLGACEQEISSQFQNLSAVDNSLKKAVLLSFFAEKALEQLKSMKTSSFVSQFDEKVNQIKKEYEALEKTIKAHVSQNVAVLKEIEAVSATTSADSAFQSDMQRLITEVKSLLDKSDEGLKEIINRRDQLHLENLVLKRQK